MLKEQIFVTCSALFQKAKTKDGYVGKLLAIYDYKDQFRNDIEQQYLVHAGCFGNFYVYSYYPIDSTKLHYDFDMDQSCIEVGMNEVSDAVLYKVLEQEYNLLK